MLYEEISIPEVNHISRSVYVIYPFKQKKKFFTIRSQMDNVGLLNKKRQKSPSGAMLLVYLPRGRDAVSYRDALHQTDPLFVVYQPVRLF